MQSTGSMVSKPDSERNVAQFNELPIEDYLMSQNFDQLNSQRRGTYDSGYEGGNISA
jgi:hypothetical protein